MLHLRFQHPVNPETPRLGPVSEVVAAGDCMLADGEEVAAHRNHQWHRADRAFTVVSVEGRVRVRFERDGATGSAEYGPYAGVKLVDGTIRFGNEYREVVARLDEATGSWQLYSEDGEWARAVMTTA